MGADMYYIRGVHKERGLSIVYSCLNCAFETFAASVNGMLLNVEYSKQTVLGDLLMSQGKKALVAEIKRMLRASRKKIRYCTYGYLDKGTAKRYFYIRQLIARTDKLSERLWAYKDVKRYFREQGWKVHTSTTTRLGADYKAESSTEDYTELDPDGLIRINFVREDTLLVPMPEKKTERRGA